MSWRHLASLFLSVITAGATAGVQTAAPSGIVSVRLVQGVDSTTTRAGRALPGTVVGSSDGSIPAGTGAAVVLTAEAAGLSLQLARLGVNGQMWGITSSSPTLVSGPLVPGPTLSLPPNTVVRFTITQAVARGPARLGPSRPGFGAPVAVAARHPSNTARDVAPAAAGYPALHASHDAEEGCWWAPFLSQRWGFEATVQECADPGRRIPVVDSEHGLAFTLQGQAPEDFLEVRSKPASQPMTDAVKEQFIAKLKVPAARISCRAKRDADSGGPGVEVYAVTASGPYGRQKKFLGEDATEEACPGLETGDALTVQFVYLPVESTTKFFVLRTLDYGNYFDFASIRFSSQP